MKIFLLQSYLGRREKPIYPIGLAYLGASLQEHEVEAFDPNVVSDPYAETAKRIDRFKPDVVGLSLRNIDTTQYRDPFVYTKTIQRTLDIISSNAPKSIRIIGGSGFSIYARGIMDHFNDLDFGVLLEGEESFPALLKDLNNPEHTPGIFYRSEGKTFLSAPPRLPDFNALPSPKWDVVDLDPYRGKLDTFGVQGKRGCGLRCAYCTYFFLNGSHYRLRDPEKIVNEIKQLIAQFKIDHFIFVDSIFNIPREHAEKICEELIRQKVKVPWTAWYNDREFDESFLKLSREAGCRYYSFSPDAYSEKSLKLLRKSLRVKDIDKIYELARNNPDLFFGFNFFVNPPGQTYRDFIRLMKFWLKVRINLRGRLYGFGMGNIRVEPDTEILRIAIEEGIITEDTDLLAMTDQELKKLFYTNPGTPLIDSFFKIFGFLAKIKHSIRS